MKLIHSTCNNQTATTVFNEYCKQEDITSKNFKKLNWLLTHKFVSKNNFNAFKELSVLPEKKL